MMIRMINILIRMIIVMLILTMRFAQDIYCVWYWHGCHCMAQNSFLEHRAFGYWGHNQDFPRYRKATVFIIRDRVSMKTLNNIHKTLHMLRVLQPFRFKHWMRAHSFLVYFWIVWSTDTKQHCWTMPVNMWIARVLSDYNLGGFLNFAAIHAQSSPWCNSCWGGCT